MNKNKLASALCLLFLIAISKAYAAPLTWQQLTSLRPLPPARTATMDTDYKNYREKLKAIGLTPEYSVYRNIFMMTEEETRACMEQGCSGRYELTQNHYGYW